MNNKAIAYTFAGVLLIIGIVLVLAGNSSNKSATVTPAPSVVSSVSPSGTGVPATPSAALPEISFSGTSFTPASTVVRAGSKVMFTNKSDENVQVDSDPHPTHTSNPDLNIGLIPPGESKTVTLVKSGSFGIHDHLNSSITAKITVE